MIHEAALEPHGLWTAWVFDPAVWFGCAAAALLYGRGLRALWARAGEGRGVARWQARCYYAGLVTVVLALESPLDPLSDALFTAHMTQHLLLIVVAAPLLAAGAPLLVWLWAFPRGARRSVRRVWSGTQRLLNPISAWLLHAGALWAWHLPGLYDLAVRNEWVHALEHTCFLVTGVLFWWVIFPRGGALRRAQGAALLYLLTFTVQAGILGAFLTLSTHLWYHAHLLTTQAWGLTPLQDQQLAGTIMWVPGGLFYLAGLVTLFYLWMREAERRVERLEARNRRVGAGLRPAAESTLLMNNGEARGRLPAALPTWRNPR